jgi:RNA-directed DNA polymerase
MKKLEELASAFQLSVDELRMRTASPDHDYDNYYYKRKRSGGRRRIDPPMEPLKETQQLARDLLAPLITSPIVYGVKDRIYFDAARTHERQPFVGTLDAEDFYSSVRTGLVRWALRNAGFEDEALEWLVALLIRDGRLRQGPPSSPAMANLVLAQLDERVAAEALRLRVKVTRVVDDFAISGSDRSAVREMQRFITRQLRDLGLRVNRQKTSIMDRHEPQVVHGLTVNNGVAIPKNKKTAGRRVSREALRSEVRRVVRYGCSVEEREELLGLIGHVKYLHPRQAKRLRAELLRSAS